MRARHGIGHDIGLIGARGHVGRELLRLVAGHPGLALAYASSRELVGQPMDALAPGLGSLRFEDLEAEACARRGADVVVLALPNGLAAPYVAAIAAARPETILVDLSADHRFDPAWTYGLPEHFRDRLRGARRISNPGCYATAMQLALRPLLPVVDRVVAGDGDPGGAPRCFGVSGYSGAGTTPSPRNDPGRLSDNLLPYSLAGHVHEREVGHHLGAPVRFLPHVAGFFRGLSITASVDLAPGVSLAELQRAYTAAYAAAPLVAITDHPPEIRDVAGTPRALVGGLAESADGRHLAVVAALDNLLKGAASQALQNINLALGLDELTGIAA